MSTDETKLPLTAAQRAELIKRARSGNYHFGGCNEDERIKDYCNCADEFISDLADALEAAEQPEGRSYDRCAHIGSPNAIGTRANMPCRIPRKDHLEAGDESDGGYLFDHDFVEPTEQASDDTEEEREGDFRVDAQRLPNCHAQGTLFWNNLVGASNEYAGDDILEKCVCENPDSKICLYCRLWEIRNTDFLAGVEWLLQRWAKFTVNDDAILDAAEQAWQITEGWANLSHRPRPTTRERLKETIGAALARREAE